MYRLILMSLGTIVLLKAGGTKGQGVSMAPQIPTVDGHRVVGQTAKSSNIQVAQTDDGTVYTFTVNPGEHADRDPVAERSELSLRERLKFGAEVDQSYSFRANALPTTESWVMLGQWHGHQGKTKRGPWLAVLVTNKGRLWIRTTHFEKGEKDPPDKDLLYNAPFELNKWYDIHFHFRTGPANIGFVEAWVDGKKVGDYKGALGYMDEPTAGYWKFGIYRYQPGAKPITVEYRHVKFNKMPEPAKAGDSKLDLGEGD